MAKNIFSQMKEYVKQPKRNTFDLSFQNNLTMEFGKLYPVFVKDVIPGDSFRITPSFGLRFMPTAFPVQTRMNANLHFFYVRNRNLWKDWPDFIGRTKQGLTMPYLAHPEKVASTRALGDYMGLPTTIVGNYGVDAALQGKQFLYPTTATSLHPFTIIEDCVSGAFSHVARINMSNHIAAESVTDAHAVVGKYYGALVPSTVAGAAATVANGFSDMPSPLQRFSFRWMPYSSADGVSYSLCVLFARKRKDSDVYEWCARVRLPLTERVGDLSGYTDDEGFPCHDFDVHLDQADEIIAVNENGSYYPSREWSDVIESLHVYGTPWKMFVCNATPISNVDELQFFNGNRFHTTTSKPNGSYDGQLNYGAFRGFGNWTMHFAEVVVREVYDIPDAHNLYASSGLRVSALPFRAYESIYNAFYRNQQNDPFTINGVPEYNKFIPTNEGGADNSDYALRYRNWELDYLTSAVQSPQQGIAPLVGITASGEFTFQNEDGSTFTAQATVGEDGNKITGIYIQSDADNKTPDGAVQTGTLRTMRELIMSPNGISISDFRNVNALQRWLETNMRRGFRYKDQLMSHFGVDAEYKELDMPEFIGGMSEPILTNQVTQTSEGTEENPLGSYAGQASVMAESKHSITHYCDEHGFIIGILSISPVPNYSQLLPKHFIKHDTLDFFFPEFGHIGMQPLTYEEVCPIQSFAAGDSITDVFGYQRAWYDYIQSTDEVHGLMRTELRNFLVNRQFDSRPELGAEFLHVNPNDVNDIFTVTDVTDKIMGAIWFSVQAKRPIPKFGIPRLEA